MRNGALKYPENYFIGHSPKRIPEPSDNRVSDGSGIRFGKYPKKRISGYLNVPFIISSNRSFLESCCK